MSNKATFHQLPKKSTPLTPRTWNRGVKPYSITVPSQARIIHSGGTRVGSFK